MPEILHQLLVRGAPTAVYEALTTPAGLATWWTHDVTGDPAVGKVLEFGFNHRTTVLRMQVAALQPEHRVEWHCLGGQPEWENTHVSFTLTAVPEGTIVRFHHSRWLWRDGILAQCSFDWARYLLSLRTLVETGAGAPHTG
jgi:uncharacterized protein YndB with AHSA1/START domain